MKAARCAPTLCGGKPNDLAADTASHRLNFLAARLNGTESPPKRPAIRRMSNKSNEPMAESVPMCEVSHTGKKENRNHVASWRSP